jgi:hypothetical protein
MADPTRVIIVPVQVDAYINYAYPAYKTFLGASAEKAYLAPLALTDQDGLTPDSSLVKHDIFDDIRPRPYGSKGDPYRQIEGRSGIYLHWALPKTYRSGVLGSETGSDNLQQAKVEGGYPLADDQSPDGSTPTYRPVPSRWIITREITSLSGGNLQVQQPNADQTFSPTDWIGPKGTTQVSLNEVFVVLGVRSQVYTIIFHY